MNDMKVKPQLIKEAVERLGTHGMAKLSIETGLSISMLGKLMAGNYSRGLSIKSAMALKTALNVESLEDLFVQEKAS